jgi:hypothetical protein
MYQSRWKYYLAIVLDLFMRFAWALQFVPATADSPLGSWWSMGYNPLIAGVEMVRRTGWAMLRVENEHLQEVVYRARREEEERRNQAEHSVSAGTHGVLGEPLLLLVDGEGEFSPEEQQAAREAQKPKTSGFKLLLEIALLVAAVLAVSLIAYFTN